MVHSYVSNLMHCTFSTKGRYPVIDSELESPLTWHPPSAVRGADCDLAFGVIPPINRRASVTRTG